MITKSDIDRMLDMLESFRAIVPGHVRQLLRMLAMRCDEIQHDCDDIQHVSYHRIGALAERVAALEKLAEARGVQLNAIQERVHELEKHLLSNMKNAEITAKAKRRAALDKLVAEAQAAGDYD